MITKYLAIFRTKDSGFPDIGWVRGKYGRAAYLHIPRLRLYIRVGELK